MRKIVVSFDLDFTLINNKQGILNSFKFAFENFKLPQINSEDLVKTIGIPLRKAFQKFTNFDPEKLIIAFRDFYSRKGIYQVELYPTVIKLLEDLRKENIIIGVVTSKKKELAIKLLKNLGIWHYFDFIIGESSEIKAKTDPKIKEYFITNFPEFNYIVVGDNPSDKNLAIMLECPFIGLLTGVSSRTELENECNIPILILDDISYLTNDKIKKIIEIS
ncbi:MAG: HAD family hydrolase [Promethearchaeota archaeon]|nr:MAG: HAD family hydrolase [Candidatus Lokiarchaeota archaeon]